MRIRRLIGVLAIASVWACGIDTAGLLLVNRSDAGLTARSREAGTAAWTEDGATETFNLDGAPAPQGDAANISQSDASADAKGLSDSGLSDAGATDHVEAATSGTPCEHLMQCCGRLILAPPLAAACYLSSQQPDGGDGGTCEATLATFQDSGLCP